MKKKNTPSPEQLRAAEGKTVQDIIAPDLKVLFCGINPGLYSGAVGHHFARPGNRFWKTLYGAGYTPRLFSPDEEQELLQCGIGITNIVSRATRSAAELSLTELRKGKLSLIKRIELYQPKILAVLGIDAYRQAFGNSRAQIGQQSEIITGTILWVLPNPSGLNANYQIEDFVALFKVLRNKVSLIIDN